MPDLPEPVPYVPKLPKIDPLPPEVPWPPDFQWPPIPDLWRPSPSPWHIEEAGFLPPCWPQFATRFMALVLKTAAWRASLGLVPGWPPFDLRTWTVATPQLVEMACAYFVTMWNTVKIPTYTTVLYGPTCTEHDATIREWDQGFWNTGYLYLSVDYGFAVSIPVSGGIPTDVMQATLYLALATWSGSGTLQYAVRCLLGERKFYSYSDFMTARNSASLHSRGSMSSDSGALLIDLTSVIQANPGAQALTVFVDDIDNMTPPGVDRRHGYASFGSNNPPYLAIKKKIWSDTVQDIGPLKLGEAFDCARMLAWVAQAEGVAKKYGL